MNAIIKKLRPRSDKGIPFLIFISFLATFIISRLFITFFPDFFLTVRGNHVHHFAYGILLLSILGYYALVVDLTEQTRLRLSILYGIALGLAFDEFAMWLQLEDVYSTRSDYDAIMVIALILFNVVYFDSFWKRWSGRMTKLLTTLFWHVPKNIIKVFQR